MPIPLKLVKSFSFNPVYDVKTTGLHNLSFFEHVYDIRFNIVKKFLIMSDDD